MGENELGLQKFLLPDGREGVTISVYNSHEYDYAVAIHIPLESFLELVEQLKVEPMS